MTRINKKELLILLELRRNARETLTTISKRTGVPVSTIFDKLKHNMNHLVKKHTSLIDFSQLGYGVRMQVALKVHKDYREEAREFLLKHPYVNSAYRVNNGYHYLVDVVLKDLTHVERFLEELENNFRIEEKQVFYIIDELKQEAFLDNNEFALSSF
ncbi:MAG TPA: Lrp/AsnC ligand binding domain-containing protein [Candidatus Nanoarchaeia archaeon]|nr:Lrp/AsnC ligand binding domain-containing protein [Candidatus Nanoarchaeia archaeon]